MACRPLPEDENTDDHEDGKKCRDREATDRETVIRNLFSSEYSNPVRIVAFNPADGWCRDVTVDIADEVLRRCAERDEISGAVLAFLVANRC